MSEVKVSTKGQVVLPKDVRKKLGLKPGDRLRVEVENGRVMLQPSTEPPNEIFVKTGQNLLEQALEESNKPDEAKIKALLRSLGINS